MKSSTFAELYKEVLNTLVYKYNYTSRPRGKTIKECTNMILILTNPLSNMFFNQTRSTQNVLKYLKAELKWYFLKENNASAINQASSFWNTIKNPNGTVNSNYGRLIFNSYILPEFSFNKSDPDRTYSAWEWAQWALRNDKDTRQAVIHFLQPYHLWDGNKDIPCTVYGNFLIRNNKLHFTVHMRSQDVIKGLQYDLPFFTILQQQMRSHLLSTYLHLELGDFTLIINSAHLYKENYVLARKMLKKKFIKMELPPLRQDLISLSGISNKNLLLNTRCDDTLINFINNYDTI